MTDQIAMTQQQESTATVPADARPTPAPFWHVILLDDDDHTYDYVIEMLGKIFGHGLETAFQMACEVDMTGRVIVDTTTLERAELKRDQIHAYGRDRRLERSQGSMSATIEPAV
jgi:ATP-dependent Clp protease adaptor protein ClpS